MASSEATSESDLEPNSLLVRSFSDDLNETQNDATVARGLANKVKRDRSAERRLAVLRHEWVALFADADHLAEINVPLEEQQLLRCSRALAKSWEKFQKKLPKEQQEAIRRTPPSLEILFNAVKDAHANWDTKRKGGKWGKFKSSFARLSASADDHSQLLNMLPNNDKYVCLITGALTAIAQASKNHDELAASVADVIDSLCDDISHWKKQLSAHRDVPSMQSNIRELYVVIFEFLTDLFTGWSQSAWERLGKAFDKNAVNKLFTSKQERIKRLTEKLDRAAELDTQEKIANMHQKFGREVTRADLDAFLYRLGSWEQRFLEELETRRTLVRRVGPSDKVALILDTESGEDASNAGLRDEQVTRYERREILAYVADAHKFLDQTMDNIEQLINKITSLQVDVRVVATLRDWTAEKGKSCVWLQGPAHTAKPSQNTLTAIALTVAAKNSGLPVDLYFCDVTHGPRRSAKDHLQDAVKSLLVHSITALPEAFATSADFSSTRIDSSFGNSFHISSALALLKDLDELAISPVMRIIDGWQTLEDRSCPEQTRNLSALTDTLCGGASGCSSKLGSLVCFTTDGYVDAIARQAQNGRAQKVVIESESDDVGAGDSISFSRLGLDRDGSQ